MLTRIPGGSKPRVRILQRLARCWKVTHHSFLSNKSCSDCRFWRAFYPIAKWGKSSAVSWTETKVSSEFPMEIQAKITYWPKQSCILDNICCKSSPGWAQCTHLFLHVENHLFFSLPDVSYPAGVTGCSGSRAVTRSSGLDEVIGAFRKSAILLSL